MRYFCSGRCPRVQRIFVNYLRFFWAIKIRVALEHTDLARVFERKFKKNIPKIILGVDQKRNDDLGGGGALG